MCYALNESSCLGLQLQTGGKFHLRLNIGRRPIVHKYREGKMNNSEERVKQYVKLLEWKRLELIAFWESPALSHRRVFWVGQTSGRQPQWGDSCALPSCRTASVSAGREKNHGKVAPVRGGVIALGWIPRLGLRCDPQRIPLTGNLRAFRLASDLGRQTAC